MKTLITAIALSMFAASSTVAIAQGCHKTCADGYTYSHEAGGCVKKSVSS